LLTFVERATFNYVVSSLFLLNQSLQAIVVCRHCGRVGDHYTLKCPYRDLMPAKADGAAGPAPDEGAPAATGSYVPPALRQGTAAAAAAASGEVPIDQLTRIRIGNLDEDTTEDEVRELVSQYGRVDRVTLAKHRETQKVSAAYVSFYTHSDAENARKNLEGVGWRYLVLKVEWARPNPGGADFKGSGGLSSGFVSGYGKALPQMPGGGAGAALSRPVAK
jgi:translation initiation factor 3 subunit G